MLSAHRTPQALRFARWVGTAPGTSTIRYYNPYATPQDMRGGLGVASNANPWRTGRPQDSLPGTSVLYIPGGLNGLGVVNQEDHYRTGVQPSRCCGTSTIRLNADGSAQLMGAGGGLGINTHEMQRSLSGAPVLPDFQSVRLLQGGLGTIPNDFELGPNMGYTPVHSGWVRGEYPNGKQYIRSGLYGADPASDAVSSDDTILEEQLKLQHQQLRLQKRQTYFQGITTFAIVALAATAVLSAFSGRKV